MLGLARQPVVFSLLGTEMARPAAIIALHGKKGHGKDTIADYLHHNFGYKKHAFATPLKKATQALFDFAPAQLEDRDLKEAIDARWGFSPRWALQHMGTEFVRNMIGEDALVKRLQMEIEPLLAQGQLIVVTDVRFPNELRALKAYEQKGYEVWSWKVDATLRLEQCNPMQGPTLDVITETHASERGLPDTQFELIIDNNGSLDDLREALETTMAIY